MKSTIIPHRAAGLLAAALLITVVSAQNVGIGTTTPKSKLSVNGSTASGGMAIGDATYTSTTGTVAPLNGAIIQGFTGIGTKNPVGLLTAVNDQSTAAGTTALVSLRQYGPTRALALECLSANGTEAAPTSLSTGDSIGGLYFSGYANNAATGLSAVTASYRGNGTTGLSDIGFAVSGATRMVMDPQGQVGINTLTPQSRLDVRGTTKVMATAGTPTGNFWNGTSSANGFEVTANTGTGDVFVGIQRAGALAPLHLAKPAGGAAVGDPYLLFIVDAANVGTITRTAGGVAYNTTSDERLKEHIRPSAKGLGDVMKIQVSDYNYKTRPDHAETGFIAQQLQTVFPDAVTPGGEDPAKNPWTVDYGRVTPVLAKAIQEQQAEIGSLKAEVATLADENRQLKAQAATVAALAAKMEALEKLVQTNTENNRTAMISK
jgi:hypothetical protein